METDNSEYSHKFKIVVCGSNAVGKTTLLRSISDQKFDHNYIPTLGVNISTIQINFDGDKENSNAKVSLSIWDIAGQFFSRNLPIHQKFYNSARAALLVFDLTREETFKDIPEWLNTIKNNLGTTIPFILVGNKMDLEEDRKIETSQGEEKAKELNCPYIETSALNGINVKASFKKLSSILLNSH